MAALVRHVRFKSGLLNTQNTFVKCFATKAEKKKGLDRKVTPKIDAAADSLRAKGFLRHQKEYAPPSDVKEKLTAIFESVLGTSDENAVLKDLNKKFAVFTECSNAFQHCIPNSMLYTINSLEDVRKFYETPVETITPLDRMRYMKLPQNLHVQFEYHRFHPDSDTKFKGITAFPESSTLVTGLKYKDKYKGHVQKIKHPEL